MFKKALWIIISLVAAFALSVIAGLVNPSEKINALWLVVAAGCFYVITYRFSVHVHHHSMRLHIRFPLPYIFRHYPQNDNERKRYPSHRLRRHAC